MNGAAVGLRLLGPRDAVQNVELPVAVLYPSRGGAERPRRFGPYTVDADRDADPDGEDLPIVVISHGNEGSPWTHRGLAARLARAGHAVVLPEHLGNSRSDRSLTHTPDNLVNRPRHVRLALDAALADPVVGGSLRPGGVAVIGHSIGGYTALAVAGGEPATLPHETAGRSVRFEVDHDPRVGALVLLAPACPWFVHGSLRAVDVPIMLRTGERDELVPPTRAAVVESGVADPAAVDHRIVPGAGHHSFQDPFPPSLAGPHFPPSQDPEGFDRAAYQAVLAEEILAFLRGAAVGPQRGGRTSHDGNPTRRVD